jgi:hypothetical protein
MSFLVRMGTSTFVEPSVALLEIEKKITTNAKDTKNAVNKYQASQIKYIKSDDNNEVDICNSKSTSSTVICLDCNSQSRYVS